MDRRRKTNLRDAIAGLTADADVEMLQVRTDEIKETIQPRETVASRRIIKWRNLAHISR